jgi:hypothetical protein
MFAIPKLNNYRRNESKLLNNLYNYEINGSTTSIWYDFYGEFDAVTYKVLIDVL